jgi:hypothetical protein
VFTPRCNSGLRSLKAHLTPFIRDDCSKTKLVSKDGQVPKGFNICSRNHSHSGRLLARKPLENQCKGPQHKSPKARRAGVAELRRRLSATLVSLTNFPFVSSDTSLVMTQALTLLGCSSPFYNLSIAITSRIRSIVLQGSQYLKASHTRRSHGTGHGIRLSNDYMYKAQPQRCPLRHRRRSSLLADPARQRFKEHVGVCEACQRSLTTNGDPRVLIICRAECRRHVPREAHATTAASAMLRARLEANFLNGSTTADRGPEAAETAAALF